MPDASCFTSGMPALGRDASGQIRCSLQQCAHRQLVQRCTAVQLAECDAWPTSIILLLRLWHAPVQDAHCKGWQGMEAGCQDLCGLGAGNQCGIGTTCLQGEGFSTRHLGPGFWSTQSRWLLHQALPGTKSLKMAYLPFVRRVALCHAERLALLSSDRRGWTTLALTCWCPFVLAGGRGALQ